MGTSYTSEATAMKNANEQVQGWIEELRAQKTKELFSMMIRKFFEWYQREKHKTADDFIQLSASDMKHLILAYQNSLSGKPSNTIRTAVVAVKSFTNYLDKPINLRGKIPRVCADCTSHEFKNGELNAMFNVGKTKDKAILATMCSLGWEREGVLNLKRDFIERLLNKTKEEGERFIYFDAIREKTGVKRLGVLNPLAIEWLTKWLATPQSETSDRVFDMCGNGFDRVFKRLARDARILATGRVHSHLCRKWVMGQLSRAGFNEFEIKTVVGKTIPLSDSTYLTNIKDSIIAKYPKVYDEFLNINPPIFKTTVKREQLERLRQENEIQKQQIAELEERFNKLQEEFMHFPKNVKENFERVYKARE
jgi:hypothetical protein